MKKIILFILISSFVQNTFAQQNEADWKKFIPVGFDTLATCNGDLNKDGQKDKVLVLYNKTENREDNFDEIDRKLIILFKEGNSWKKMADTDDAILCKRCGGVYGDPFDSISISNNILVIHHYGGSAWRWEYINRFRYQDNDFYLIGKTSRSYYNGARCKNLHDYLATQYEDENLLTGQYEYRKMDEKKCKWLKNEKGKRPIKPLIKLSDFSVGS